MINPLVAWFVGILAGLMLGVGVPKIRMKVQGYVKLHFIDRDIDIMKYGKPESVDVGEKTYIIDYNKVKRHTAFFDTRFAEQLNLEVEPDFTKWKYYINSKTAYTTLHNTVLQQLMYINESNIIKIVAILVGILLVLTGINLYHAHETLTNVETILSMISEIKSNVVIG